MYVVQVHRKMITFESAANMPAGELYELIQNLTVQKGGELNFESTIQDLKGLTSLKVSEVGSFVMDGSSVFGLKLLKVLKIFGCPQFRNVPANISNLRSLEHIEIVNCENFMSLGSEIATLQLTYLHVESCVEFHETPTHNVIAGIRSLKTLVVKDCRPDMELAQVYNALASLSSLELVDVRGCVRVHRVVDSSRVRSVTQFRASSLPDVPKGLRDLFPNLRTLFLAARSGTEESIMYSLEQRVELATLYLVLEDFPWKWGPAFGFSKCSPTPVCTGYLQKSYPRVSRYSQLEAYTAITFCKLIAFNAGKL